MRNYWNDYTRGQFDIQEGWIGLDYAKLHDPLQAELTLFHEQTHAGLCATTEFGQATAAVYKESPFFKHCKKEDKPTFPNLMYESQFTVQEGLAVFMQTAHLQNLKGKQVAMKWLSDSHFPPSYYQAFSVMEFGLELSKRYRDYFTSKVSHLSMLTNIRKDAVKHNLFVDPLALQQYLSEPQNNPTERLKAICESLKYRGWMVTKSEQEIANFAGVTWFDPASQQEVADYLNYLLSLSGKEAVFKPEHINTSPKGAEVFVRSSENMIVANMNLNFTQRAMPAWKIEDFLFSCKDAQAIFIIPYNEVANQELLSFFPIEADVAYGLIGFLSNGEVYMTFVSEKTAERVLSNELANKTLMTKWNFFNQIDGKYLRSSSSSMRTPDLLIHNTVGSMEFVFGEMLKVNVKQNFTHLHAGFMENHPFQSLIVIPEGKPINIVNAFGNAGITKIINIIRQQSKVMEKNQLLSIKEAINNVMSIWMGLYWEIDWVETMAGDKETVIFRK